MAPILVPHKCIPNFNFAGMFSMFRVFLHPITFYPIAQQFAAVNWCYDGRRVSFYWSLEIRVQVLCESPANIQTCFVFAFCSTYFLGFSGMCCPFISAL